MLLKMRCDTISRKTQAAFFAATLLFVSQSCFAGFYDGNKISRWAEGYDHWSDSNTSTKDLSDGTQFLGYVAGVVDAEELSGSFCLPQAATIGQLASIVSRFLKEHPETWTVRANLLIKAALHHAFPCGK